MRYGIRIVVELHLLLLLGFLEKMCEVPIGMSNINYPGLHNCGASFFSTGDANQLCFHPGSVSCC